MKNSAVVITCYNYEDYIGDAIRSVQAQTMAPAEVVVIDDGSIDGSRKVATSLLDGDSRGKVVTQENQGQLASFEAGVRETTAEWVFFLDADDEYSPDHIEIFQKALEKNPKGTFFFCRPKVMGDSSQKVWCYQGPYGDFGYSSLLALGGMGVQCAGMIGSVTSGLCIHRSVLEDFLPLPQRFHKEWRTRADDVLNFGSSFAGARKIGIEDHFVNYRIHGSNAHAGQDSAKLRDIGRAGIAARLKGELANRFGYNLPGIMRALASEYAEVPFKTRVLRAQYLKAALHAELAIDVRFRQWWRIRKMKGIVD
ncbi:glycosyltransferase family 2 protein [Roseibacillus persicicus]|uniref:glycosyltransferase family 2 protein n=1 Tax=Roseibacillus persicicus TaxID=454148 RepID=UPI00398ACE7B